MKDGDKQRAKRIRRAVDRVNDSLDNIKKRQEEAVQRFKKNNAKGRCPDSPKLKNAVTIDPEYQLQLEAAQIGIRIALATGTWFFENKEIAERGSQTENERKLYEDPTGSFEARAVIEEAKRGDRFARRALHNKLIDEIDDDFPILAEYKKYLIWLLWDTREGKRRRGRHPKLNHTRDRWIREAVGNAITHGFRLTRNRASHMPSAASLVADALTEFGVHMTEANVELIAKGVDAKKSEE
jgi:hypothetical protein